MIPRLEPRLPGGAPGQFSTILADPPWQFANRTGKMAPEHRRLHRYQTLGLGEIKALPVADFATTPAHLYLWVPNALLAEGLEVMRAWGFTYKSNLVWYKVRHDGGPDGRGVGFYFRNVTELVLFGVRGYMRTLPPGRRQVNLLYSRKREHSRKPDELYSIIESCSPGPYLELFARHLRPGWVAWGDEVPPLGEPVLLPEEQLTFDMTCQKWHPEPHGASWQELCRGVGANAHRARLARASSRALRRQAAHAGRDRDCARSQSLADQGMALRVRDQP